MARYRSILVLLLAVVATFLVSCGGSTVAAKPTYTTAQLEQIQENASNIQGLRDRLIELPPLIQQQKWVEVESFMHGPLGELRAKMSRLSRSLLTPDLQSGALKAAKDVFNHLNLIDEAVQSRDITKALRNYNEALKDFDAFFEYLPS